MLEQVGTAVTFYGFFVESKVGKTGLTVAIDVYKRTASASSQIVTSGVATELGGGLYFYKLDAGSVDAEAEYVAVFKTATTTVDAQHIPALWVVSKAGIENLDAAVTSRLAPTTAGRTLDVSAGGEAGVDWANVGSATTTLNLSGTTVKAVTDGVTLAASAIQAIWDAAVAALTTVGSIGKRIVDFLTGDAFARLGAPTGASIAADIAAVQADTDDIQTRLPAALVSGRIDASVGAMAANTLTASALAADAVTEIQAGVSAPTAAQVADAVLDELLSGHGISGSAGEALSLIDDIKLRTDLITTGNLTIGSVSTKDGVTTIIKGDSYPYAEGRAIAYEVGSANWPTDLTGYTITLTIDDGAGATMLADTLSIVTATGSSRSVRWEPTAAETGTLTVGAWPFEVKATKGSEVARLVVGIMRVRAGTT